LENTTVARNVFQDGPHLLAALLCEAVLEEKDGKKSAIRIMDRVTLMLSATTQGDGPLPALPHLTITPTLLLRLKKGKGPDRFTLRIELVSEGGIQKGPSHSQTVMLEGGPDRGYDLVLSMRLEFDQEGLYWINVYLDQYLLTRVPLRIVFLIQRTMVPTPDEPKRPIH